MSRKIVELDNHIGAKLRSARVELGLTQENMAELLGVTYQQVHKYEKGINRISAVTLAKLCRLLNVPHSYFFSDLPTGRTDRAELELVRNIGRLTEGRRAVVSRIVLELAREQGAEA
jgi:transcriptional regulator with XRE-family HTH domain